MKQKSVAREDWRPFNIGVFSTKFFSLFIKLIYFDEH